MQSLCCCFLLSLPVFQAGAQNVRRISGTVTDAAGIPVIGAAVLDSSKGTGEVTDVDGKWSMTVSSGTVLNVNCLGYLDQTIKINDANDVYNVVLQEDAVQLEETVVVGYGTQKKATITGSVAAVTNSEIMTTKNESVSNMLSGKVAGLTVVQNSSEPGQFDSSLNIRGFGAPLVIIDGVPRDNMARIDPEDIESISVLKDASAAIYGVRSGNGLIIITTKKGGKGKASISYSGNMTWQMPSDFPELVDAADWMSLYNERSRHNVDNQNNIVYSDEEIASWRDGTNRSTLWVGEVFRKSAPQTQHNINVSGGNDRISYFASAGYQYQGSFLQTDAINYRKYNLRSNVSAKITDNLLFDISLSGMMDERRSGVYSAWDIVRAMWISRPMDQVWYNEEEGKYAAPKDVTHLNPVAAMDTDLTGSNSYKSRWFQSTANLRWNLPWVKGLYIKGMFSYDFIQNDNKEFTKMYSLYNDAGNEIVWNRYTVDGSQYPGRVSRYYYGKNALLWQAQIGYERSFGKHNLNVMALLEDSHKDGDNFYGRRYIDLPLDQIFTANSNDMYFNQSSDSGALYDYSNTSYIGRVQYDYADKYIAEFSFRYEASSRFSSYNRWAFSPSVLVGYVMSEEKFWKQSGLKFINKFKIRASYGQSGVDSSLNYQFLTGYEYPFSGKSYALPGGTVFDGSFVNASVDKGLANRALSWQKISTFNVGLDAQAWGGQLNLTADYFYRRQDGKFATKVDVLPGVVGASLPQENLNSDMNQGFEIELGHENRVGEFVYAVKANVAYTMTKDLHVEWAKAGNSYDNWRNNKNNRVKNIWWGYEGNGRITSWDEIYYNPIFIGRGTVMGDYEYLDWNGDGMISDLDVHPIATTGSAPLVNYGITFNLAWKGIDFSMLLQGASRRFVAPREFLYQPLWADTNALTQYLDRWHTEDPTANPYNPATKWVEGEYGMTGSLPNFNSTFNVKNAAYLRLKTIELGYSLPKKWLNAIRVQNIRIYVSGYNLLTFSKLKYMDPEYNVTEKNYGYNYPINKTVTLGLNVKF